MDKFKAMNRIKIEFDDINNNPLGEIGVTIGLNDENNIFGWSATLQGPKDTGYKGGIFLLDINFPENYPESPPEILFVTPIYHLNINSSSQTGISVGKVYCNSLNNWKNYFTMRKIFPEIFVLLYKNNPDCGYDSEKNKEFRCNRTLFEQKVKYFTKKYATPQYFGKIQKGIDWIFNYP